MEEIIVKEDSILHPINIMPFKIGNMIWSSSVTSAIMNYKHDGEPEYTLALNNAFTHTEIKEVMRDYSSLATGSGWKPSNGSSMMSIILFVYATKFSQSPDMQEELYNMVGDWIQVETGSDHNTSPDLNMLYCDSYSNSHNYAGLVLMLIRNWLKFKFDKLLKFSDELIAQLELEDDVFSDTENSWDRFTGNAPGSNGPDGSID